jgi:hypothetical protein|tara:strand:+ start:85 stop:426 length:342 start_codon:yes stop_codon:yes gene_type:complete
MSEREEAMEGIGSRAMKITRASGKTRKRAAVNVCVERERRGEFGRVRKIDTSYVQQCRGVHRELVSVQCFTQMKHCTHAWKVKNAAVCQGQCELNAKRKRRTPECKQRLAASV